MSEQRYRTDYFSGYLADDQMREFVPFNVDGQDQDPQPIPGENGQIVAVSVTYHTIRTAQYLFPADWTQEQIAQNLKAGFFWVGQFEAHDQELRFVSSVEDGYEHGDWTFRVMVPEGAPQP